MTSPSFKRQAEAPQRAGDDAELDDFFSQGPGPAAKKRRLSLSDDAACGVETVAKKSCPLPDDLAGLDFDELFDLDGSGPSEDVTEIVQRTSDEASSGELQ